MLEELARRASDPFERVLPPFLPAGGEHAAAARREARWVELGGGRDPGRLARSLAWRGIDLAAIRPALGGASLAGGAALPAWTASFEGLVDAAVEEVAAFMRGARGMPRFIRPAEPYPFEMVLAPFVLAATRRVDRVAAGDVAAAAWAGLERALLFRLVRLCGSVLETQWARHVRQLGLADGDALMRAFSERMLAPPVPAFLADYPVLARLVTLGCDNWVDAVDEMLARVRRDRPALGECFGGGAPLGGLTDVRFGDADVHDGHRAVAILTFASGTRLVYKPRSLELDAAFEALVGHLNRRGLSHGLGAPAVFRGDGYGYAAFIESRPAADEAALARFYHRMGALVALTSVLGSTDLHYSNVIASGDMPVPIDLETILSAPAFPRSATVAPPAAAAAGPARPWAVETMLLPTWHKVRGGVFTDRSAIGADLPGTDTDVTSLPCGAGELEAVLGRHAGALLAGFEEMYRVLLANREALLLPGGPLDAFADGDIRIVLRETWLYIVILAQSVDAQVLRDGADRAVALERLNHVSAVSSHATFAPVVARERVALAALDVPRFGFRADGVDLRDRHGVVIAGACSTSPLDEARRRLGLLGEDDLSRQLALVRGSLAARLAKPPSACAREAVAAGPPGSRSDLVARAVAIASGLTRHDWGAVTQPPPGFAFEPQAGRWVWTLADDGLGHGRLGVAVLFAAVSRFDEGGDWRRTALGLAGPVFDRVAATLGVELRPHMPWLGIESGLGGWLLAAAALARLLGPDVIPVPLMEAVASLAPPAGCRVDVSGGAAGALLGFVALHQATGDERLLSAAGRCAAPVRAALDAGVPESGWFGGRHGMAWAIGRLTPGVPLAPPGDAMTGQGLDGLGLAALMAGGDGARADALARAGLASLDSYRLGNAGEIDALLMAGRRLGRSDLVEVAHGRGAAMAARADASGWSLLPGARDSETLVVPGLFDGVGGIAYALLRLADPDRVPSLAALLAAEPDIEA